MSSLLSASAATKNLDEVSCARTARLTVTSWSALFDMNRSENAAVGDVFCDI